jgi:hypothetical protein
MVEKRARTMADEMAQLVDAQITLGLPAALAPTADSTSGPSMEYRSSKAETQVRMIIMPTDLGQVSSS